MRVVIRREPLVKDEQARIDIPVKLPVDASKVTADKCVVRFTGRLADPTQEPEVLLVVGAAVWVALDSVARDRVEVRLPSAARALQGTPRRAPARPRQA